MAAARSDIKEVNGVPSVVVANAVALAVAGQAVAISPGAAVLAVASAPAVVAVAVVVVCSTGTRREDPSIPGFSTFSSFEIPRR
jgi:hypothetical protein